MGFGISRRTLFKVLAAVAGSLGLGKLLGQSQMQSVPEESYTSYLPYIEKGVTEPSPTITATSAGTGAATPTSTPNATATATDTETATPTSTPTATATATDTETATPTSTPSATATATDTPTPASNTPVPPHDARVVHVHSSDATVWSGQTDYWNYVNQGVVDEMVNRGMMALTGASTVAAAWQSLLPDYSPGRGIAIKVNLNNSTDCSDTDGQIDALIQPVNAIVRGLKLIGVAPEDIWVYDAIRWLPDRLVTGIEDSGVRFFDKFCREQAHFFSNDPNAYVSFNPPAGVPVPPATKITDVIIDATYLINMPIMKPHSLAGVTLSFKNHFGTIEVPFKLHDYIDLGKPSYRSDYSPFVDIYQNPHIVSKTILTVGDGLFAARGFNVAPSLWTTFGDHVPNSLFFSADPVAIDCVMCDLLDTETTLPDQADDYLQIAGNAGLGVYERGNPWGSGYQLIDYLRIDI